MTFTPNPKPSQKAGAKPKKSSAFKKAPQPVTMAERGPIPAKRPVRTASPLKALTPSPAGQTKGALIQSMLVKGATSKELEAATGWKPHSVRGYLGTLRKSGVNVVSHKVKGEPTVYRVEVAEVL